MRTFRQALQERLFTVSAELGFQSETTVDEVLRQAELLSGVVDGFQVAENPQAYMQTSVVALAALLKQRGLDPVPQLCCRDRNRIALQSDILGASALGIRNVLCLSGDHQCFGNQPQAAGVFDLDSIQFVEVVRNMRDQNVIAGGEALDAAPDLFIGAAANPFGDPQSFRAVRLGKKVRAGADFIQTQCIYNLERFETWLHMVREKGLTEQTAILGGVTPLKSAGMARYMKNKVSGMDIPDAVIKRMEGVPKENQREEGIRICVETIERLKEMDGVRGVHIMAIEWEDAVAGIVENSGLFPRPALEQG